MRQHLQHEESTTPVLSQIGETKAVSAPQANLIQQDSQAEALSVDALLATVKKQARRHAWLGGIAMTLAGLFGFVIAMSILIFFMLGHEGHWPKVILDLSLTSFGGTGQSGPGQSEMTISGVTPLLLMLGCGYFSTLARKERARLSRTLAQCDDVRAVGPLIEALFLRNRNVTAEAAEALKRLLPRLQAEDADLLTEGQCAYLRLYLAFRGEDPDLVLAIVKAYEQIGRNDDLLFVQKLAAGKGKAGKDRRVQEAAQAYLDYVRKQEELRQAPQVLLRASGSADVSTETLLRAAEGAPDAAPDQLLRPTDSGAP